MSNILGKLNLSFATKKFKKKFSFLTDKYLTEFSGQHVKAIQNLIVYKDKGFKELTGYTIERNVVFMPSEVVFTKAGTPRLKLPNGYITASKKYVELTNEPITKRRIAIDGQMQQVRYDVENYITALDGKNVKALSELKVYKDIDFKKTLGEEVQKDYVFKVDAIEVTKGGTPRLRIAKGYVTANQKFVVLTDESVTKKIMIIGGKEHQVRDDIENYITTLDSKNVKALSELKVYKDIDFKKALDTKLPKGHVFKADTIEVTKGGTPRLKIVSGYVTANKKFVTLTDEKITKKKALINGKEVLVRNDIENYITSINQKFVKALSDLTIYDDLAFKNVTERNIAKGELFKPSQIVVSKGGTPRLKVNGGYVTANKKFVCLSEDNPLVSLVIPIYNVEKYLEECLLSLQNQTYKNIEVILVNDGSPDNSVLIAEKFVAQDQRFKLHTQENAGLSAARNKGIELSTGQYIWFIDSDDIITPNAVQLMVQNLLNSGSDFAVGCYRRFNSTGFKKPAHWISDLHSKTINNTTLQQSANVLVNAIACSKVINRKYIMNNDLFFEVGILYEDQLWSAKLFSNSKSFDIVKDVIYEWRVREDNSSITQQSQDVSNLNSILSAVQTSIDEFYRIGLDDIAHERIVQFLSNNMREYISYLDKTDRDYFEELAKGLKKITKDFPLEKWRDVPAHIASVEWLILQNDYDKVLKSIQEGVRNIYTMVATCKKDNLLLQVPFWNDVKVNFPNEVLSIKENQYKPNVELRKAEWVSNDILRIEGWAFLALINPEYVENPVTINLVSLDNKNKIELKVNSFIHPQIDRVSPYHINDYRNFGFYSFINVSELEKFNSMEYKFEFIFKVGGLQRKHELNKLASWASAGNLRVKTTSKSFCIRLFKEKNSLVLLSVKNKKILLNKFSVSNDFLKISLKSHEELLSMDFKLLDENKKELAVVKSSLISCKNDIYDFAFNLQNFNIQNAKHYLVRVNDCNGKSLPIDVNNVLEKPFCLKKTNISLYSTEYGNLGAINSTIQLYVDSIENKEKGIKITGLILGGNAEKLTAEIKDHRYSIKCKVNKNRDGKFSLMIPYLFKKWDKIGYLSSGKYKLEIYDSNQKISVLLSEKISSMLPLWLSKKPPIVSRVEYELKHKELILTVDPTIALEMQGIRNKTLNIKAHIDYSGEIDEKAVFFRTYYGESTTCCALGIHNVLNKIRKDLKLYWSVKDSSIAIPEGGIPIIEGSKEWYELYSKAKYIITNTHQPDFFRKKKGQIVVATFHGYPFKLAGLPFWKSSGISKIQIQSYLNRHNQWDYLVSPAPYATPLLEEVFPSETAQTLEIGYPRNDIFFAEDKDIIRSNVRNKLKIGDNKKVILYAPTFRDNLAVNDHHAEMVKYLDLDKLMDDLDENFVILVRGHAFNARSKDRVKITNSRIIDVTDYPEITDLCIASDVGILDYSSLRFDYTLTNNPMIFFVPDLDAYINDIRGSLVPYEETAPGPLVKTHEELVHWMKNLNELEQQFQQTKATFIEKYMPLEDGKASERFVDKVFLG